MLVAVSQHHIDNFRIEVEISSSSLDVLKNYYGNSLHIANNDDEWVNIKDTDWYKELKASYSPASNLASYRRN